MKGEDRSWDVFLWDGGSMPSIGLGTYQIRDRDVIFAIMDAALDCGYRSIDTAQVYGNEQHIGEALQELLPKYSLKRSDVFITSKLSPANQGEDKVQTSVQESLDKLRTDYIDLFLIHWPAVQKLSPLDKDNRRLRTESWKVLQCLQASGVLKSIGVSNYTVAHLEELLDLAAMKPAVNQCEFHPHYADLQMVDFCKQNSIHFQAYSSFGSPKAAWKLCNDPAIVELSQKYSCTPYQLLLSWPLSMGISVLPRSSQPDHVRQNFRAKDVKMSPQDTQSLCHLRNEQTKEKYCWDPRTIL